MRSVAKSFKVINRLTPKGTIRADSDIIILILSIIAKFITTAVLQ